MASSNGCELMLSFYGNSWSWETELCYLKEKLYYNAWRSSIFDVRFFSSVCRTCYCCTHLYVKHWSWIHLHTIIFLQQLCQPQFVLLLYFLDGPLEVCILCKLFQLLQLFQMHYPVLSNFLKIVISSYNFMNTNMNGTCMIMNLNSWWTNWNVSF